MDNPFISVIVPVYNVEKYLNRCVDSILMQTFRDFELLLVNDGSKDSSGKICDEYAQKDQRVRVIHKKNGGVSSARNTGIDAAVGAYIMFVDSDDYIDQRMLEVMQEKGKRADIVFSGLKNVEVDGTVVSASSLAPFEAVGKSEFIRSYYLAALSQYVTSGPVNKLFRKSIITEHGIRFDETVSIGEDVLFSLAYMEKCSTFTYTDKVYYCYVHYPTGSLVSQYQDNSFEVVERCYLARKAFVSGEIGIEELLQYLEEQPAQVCVGFYLRIYQQKFLTDQEKYEKVKAAWENSFFSSRMRMHWRRSHRIAALYGFHLLKLDRLMHQLLLRKYVHFLDKEER